MRLDFNEQDENRFVEFDFNGESYKVRKASTLSVAEGRDLVERSKAEKCDLAPIMLGYLVEEAGMEVATLDLIPRDMLVAIYMAVIGETEKK